MSPADIITFSKVTLRDGSTVKAMVEAPQSREPISRLMAFQMLLAASLLMEEAEGYMFEVHSKLARRMGLLRQRIEDAIAREGR